ncbi:MAG TPA: hypothetical protein VMW27_09905 [Thermoanaerobaculia bacterium]|nr:hypothetical protein [Thermoanaerobaculia bacterium]
MNTRVLFLVAGIAALAWSFRNWRKAIQLALVLVVVEGAVRKWLLPSAQDLVYFAKDAVLLAAYAGYLGESGRMGRLKGRPPQMLVALLGMAAALGLLQIFNPRLPSLLVGVLGFKSYFLYAPLLVVLPAVFPNDASLFRFLRRYVLIAIPVGLLAAAQFFSPPDSSLNTYARGGTESTATFGSSSFVRVTGTFSYITGFSTYLLGIAILILGLLASAGWKLRRQMLVYAALALTLLGMLMTGSRGPVFSLVLVFPFYWLLVMRERGSGAMIGRIALGVGLIAAFITYSAPEAAEAFRGRASSAQDFGGRVITPFMAPLDSIQWGGLFGFGIGATHQAAATLAGSAIPYWTQGITVEAESGKVMLELGPIGFFLIYMARVYLIFYSFRQARRLRTRYHRTLATACFLFLLAQLPGYVVFDPTAGVLYWFFAGLLMLAIRLDRQAVAAAASAETASPVQTRTGPLAGAAYPQRTWTRSISPRS